MVEAVGPNSTECLPTCFEAFQSMFDCIIPPDRLTEDVAAWSLFSQCPVAYTPQLSLWTQNCYLDHSVSSEELRNTNSITSLSSTVVAFWLEMAKLSVYFVK